MPGIETFRMEILAYEYWSDALSYMAVASPARELFLSLHDRNNLNRNWTWMYPVLKAQSVAKHNTLPLSHQVLQLHTCGIIVAKPSSKYRDYTIPSFAQEKALIRYNEIFDMKFNWWQLQEVI